MQIDLSVEKLNFRAFTEADYKFTHDLHRKNMIEYVDKYWGRYSLSTNGGNFRLAYRNELSSLNLLTVPGLNINTWHHVVGVIDSSEDVSIYLDGVLKDTTEFVGNSIEEDAHSVLIGARGEADDHFFNGLIDEVMIFNRPLSVEEIKSLYIKGKANYQFSSYQTEDIFNVDLFL